MSDFVSECRQEWKRLRVPDAVADEMAAELAADLSEAAAEGVQAEEVLGPGGADPRSFAASWAAGRGVIQPRTKKRPGTRSLVLAATVALSAAALAAGVAILATPPGTTSALPPTTVFSPDGPTAQGGTVWVSRSSGELTVAIDGNLFRSGGQGTTTRVVAWSLLIAGVAGLVLTALGWWTVSRRQNYA